MKTAPRRGLPALTAAVVLVLAGTLTATAPATASSSRPDPAHARALGLLHRLEALQQPSAERGSAIRPRGDVTLLLRDLRAALPALSTAERARASELLGISVPGPRTSCADELLSWKALPSAEGHFCVHYKGSIEAQANTTAQVLEQVWDAEIGRLGFRQPMNDGGGGFDVFLDDIGDQGYYGACATSDFADKSPASCVLDDDFTEFPAAPINSLQVTAAHEFFHAIQFAYNAGQAAWLMEGTAVWMEDEVYPAVNDYLQYLRTSAITYPGVPVDNETYPWVYGSVLFWKFLAESLHDSGVIRQIWNHADADYGRSALQAVRTALAVRGLSFSRVFARFAAWNTKPNGSYADRRLFPAPRWGLTATLRRVGSEARRTAVLDHLSSSAALLRPGLRLPRTARLRISVDGPNRSTGPAVLAQLRMRGGAVRYVFVPLNASGNGVTSVAFNPRRVRAVAVTLSNANVYGADQKTFALRTRVVR